MNRSPSTDQKNKMKEEKKGHSVKLTLCLVLIGCFMAALLLRVYNIQKENRDDYNKIVLSQRSKYVSQTIPAKRGDIYDRNGNRLATSEKVYIMILDPSVMNETEDANKDGVKKYNVVDTTVDAICACFDVDRDDLKKTIEDNKNSSYIRYIKNVTYDQKQTYKDYETAKNAEYSKVKAGEGVIRQKIAGVWFEDNYRRSYPYGSLACQVVGFANGDGTSGTLGVEQYYNETLNGVAGRQYGYLDDEADLEKVVKSAQDGDTLILTIDASIQNIVEKYLEEWADGDIGSKRAACIVMDPNNGEVLAMASTGGFDLNNPGVVTGYTDDDLYSLGLSAAAADYKKNNPDALSLLPEQVPDHYSREEIIEFGRSEAMYKMWRNFCVSDTYEPGSPQKIFTVAGAMEEGIISRYDTFNCEGNIQLTDGVNTWKISCVNRNGHGLLDVTGGITNSCNVVMMNIAFAEKSETFMKYEKLFGFGDYTGIDLPAEADTSQMGFQTDEIGRTQLATNSFGQNYNCTMIQMASAYCSVINGGYYYKPHVVKQILSSDGTLLKEQGKELVRRTVSTATTNYLKEALLETVVTGTGKAAGVTGYAVGGKTGTAEKLPRSAKKYLVSFCGFAPVEDPQLMCYVIVDEPNLPGEEAAHSTFASMIFSKIMAEALPAIGIYPEGVLASEYVAPTVLLPTEQDVDLNEEEPSEGTASADENASGGDPSEGEEETEPLTSAPPADEEYIMGDPDGDSELPDTLTDTAESRL